MSNLLQLTCPNCTAQLQVNRPAGTTGQVRCGKCGHSFAFRVAQPAAANAPQPADNLFSGLPDPGHTLANQPAPPRRAAHPATRMHSPKRPVTGKRRSAVLVAIVVSAAALLVGVIGVAAWFVLEKVDVIPASLTMFDSVEAILKDADANDVEMQRLVLTISGQTVPQETLEKLVAVAVDSHGLVARASRLTPMTEEEAIRLTGVPLQLQDDEKSGRLFSKQKVVPQGPLDDEAMEALREKVSEIPQEKRLALAQILGQGFRSTEFAREYLRYGHLKIPDPGKRGEQIAARKIELLRQASQLGAPMIGKIDGDEVAKLKTQTEIEQYAWGKYKPIQSELSGLADQMFELAEGRYGLPEEETGNAEKYEEIDRYAQQMVTQVYRAVIGLDHGKIKTFDALSEFLLAARDVDHATGGFLPSRIAAEKERNEPTAEQLRLQYEQQKQAAAEKRAADKKLTEEKQRAEEANAKLATANSTAEETPTMMPADNSVASNVAPADSGEQGAFPSSRFGSGRTGPPIGFGGRGGGGPPGMSGPNGAGRQGSRIGSNQPARPKFDPSTGVTIKMNDAKGIKPSDISGKFLQPLRVATHVSNRNGELTIELSYTGPLDDVAKLIDFGKVVSKDEKTRTILVEPLSPP